MCWTLLEAIKNIKTIILGISLIKPFETHRRLVCKPHEHYFEGDPIQYAICKYMAIIHSFHRWFLITVYLDNTYLLIFILGKGIMYNYGHNMDKIAIIRLKRDCKYNNMFYIYQSFCKCFHYLSYFLHIKLIIPELEQTRTLDVTREDQAILIWSQLEPNLWSQDSSALKIPGVLV